MIEIVFTDVIYLIIILGLIALNYFVVFYCQRKLTKELIELYGIKSKLDGKMEKPVRLRVINEPNELKEEPGIFDEGMGEFDIGKVENMKIDELPPQKVKIYK